MDLGLNNKLALVTASSGGIGLAIARSLAAEGAKVAVNGRTKQSVDKAVAKIRADVPAADLIPLVADNATAKGCAATIAALPSLDILVNNLGIYEAVGFFDETDADWMRVFETNIMSGVRLSRHYLRFMLDRGDGRIVFIASESAISPAPEMAHYSATKTMQLSISRSLAELTKNTRVTVNTVLPGSTRTESVETFMQDVFPVSGWHDVGRGPGSSEADFVDWLTIRNQAESVLSDVRRIRAHPLVPASVPVYGYIYDVKNGRLVEVPEASKAGRAA